MNYHSSPIMYFLLFVLVAALASARSVLHSVDLVPGTIFPGDSIATYISSEYGPDVPMIRNINSSTFSWWYFDVVSADLGASFDVFFYVFPEVAGDNIHALSVSISANFANGTVFNANTTASEAIVTSDGIRSSGDFIDSGFKWSSTVDGRHYTVAIDSPTLGVKGNISFDSVSPAHYPCGPIKPGQNLEVGPGLGWSNTLPDSVASVDLVLKGSPLSFSGVGYHDQRWSPVSFALNFDSWFWGHAHVGPYSIVWYDLLSTTNVESVSAYVARDNKIITAACSGIMVRPIGTNSTYPPGKGTGQPGAFHITADLGNEGKLEVDVTPTKVIFSNSGLYTRWIGHINGTVSGSERELGGVALFEVSNFLA